MRLNRENLLNHINDEEKILPLKKLIDKIEIVINEHIITSTDFLDPYEVELSKSILNRFDEISYLIDGGYYEAERAVIYIYPEYMYEPILDDIKILKFTSKSDIKHRDILGSVLGLGIDRRKIGDIIINDDNYYFFAKSEITNFLEFNLFKIGNNKIDISLSSNAEIPEAEFDNKDIIVSSLRLDVIISSVYNISRSKAQELIRQERVKVNFKAENKVAFSLNEKDLVSVRKFGRFIFNKITGSTKKEKYAINIKIPK